MTERMPLAEAIPAVEKALADAYFTGIATERERAAFESVLNAARAYCHLGEEAESATQEAKRE